jgi:nicotinate-nucleotide adenylyltransferase
MNIGIFGGTFDPVHIGHLRAAEEIREFFLLDGVYFVPAGIPPHKKRLEITDADIRLRMIKSAIRGNPYLHASEIELKRKGLSYSIDTVRTFEKRFKTLYFILGNDAFYEIDTWHNYREIFYHTNFIVMIRPMNGKLFTENIFPGDVKEEMEKIDNGTFRHISGNKVFLHQVTQLDISSTLIRENVRNGKTIRYVLPQSVEKIIKEKGLYRS